MKLKCIFGFHDWTGCTCSKCAKTRDQDHQWQGCKCSVCGDIRDEKHDWSKDCELCSICAKKRDGFHQYDNHKCSSCGKLQNITIKMILAELKKAMEVAESDEEQRATICISLVDLGVSCSNHIKKIVLDKSHDMYLRRFALRVGAGCRDASYNTFIRSKLIAGKNKAQLISEYNTGTTDGSEVALYVTGEEILNTPDFFERYIACGHRRETSQPKAAVQSEQINKYKSAGPSDLFPDFPLNPQNLFILGEPIINLTLANVATIGLCIAEEFQAWKNSVPASMWPEYASRELSALINAYHQMQAKVPSGIQHTVNVGEVRRLSILYVERFRKNNDLYNKFMTKQLTLLNLTIDFGNTIACGGTLQSILEWYG